MFSGTKDLFDKICGEIENFKVNAGTAIEKGRKVASKEARACSLNLTRMFKEYREATIAAEKADNDKKKAEKTAA